MRWTDRTYSLTVQALSLLHAILLFSGGMSDCLSSSCLIQPLSDVNNMEICLVKSSGFSPCLKSLDRRGCVWGENNSPFGATLLSCCHGEQAQFRSTISMMTPWQVCLSEAGVPVKGDVHTHTQTRCSSR